VLSPAATQLLELLAKEIANDLLRPEIENAAESGQEQQRRIGNERCRPYSDSSDES
jgi:hypothetical protein